MDVKLENVIFNCDPIVIKGLEYVARQSQMTLEQFVIESTNLVLTGSSDQLERNYLDFLKTIPDCLPLPDLDDPEGWLRFLIHRGETQNTARTTEDKQPSREDSQEGQIEVRIDPIVKEGLEYVLQDDPSSLGRFIHSCVAFVMTGDEERIDNLFPENFWENNTLPLPGLDKVERWSDRLEYQKHLRPNRKKGIIDKLHSVVREMYHFGWDPEGVVLELGKVLEQERKYYKEMEDIAFYIYTSDREDYMRYVSTLSAFAEVFSGDRNQLPWLSNEMDGDFFL